MNFSPFTGHIPTAIPTIHQFAAKFGYEGGAGVVQGQERGNYQAGGGVQYTQHAGGMEGAGKFRQENVVVSINNTPNTVAASMPTLTPINAVNTVKYQTISTTASNLSALQYSGQITVPYHQGAVEHQGHLMKTERHTEKREYREDMTQQDIMNTMIQQQATQQTLQQPQQLVVVLHEPKETLKPIKQELRGETRVTNQPAEFISTMPASAWQSLTGAGGAVADYLSALPLGLHHLLKYSAAEGGKREDATNLITVNGLNANMSANVGGVVVQTATLVNQAVNTTSCLSPSKKKKKKKAPKEKKPRPKPGEIRLTTALDGSTLYCCPECHMAYPERGLLEQHLVGHTMERRFICDICNAALKRKDHLTRHKQSHNPERPYVCTVCLKAFKRKEQLTLHFVIHSGEKRHICQECGKGFYRKDHLRKHARSHIARRVKAELSQQSAASSGTLAQGTVPAPTLALS